MTDVSMCLEALELSCTRGAYIYGSLTSSLATLLRFTNGMMEREPLYKEELTSLCEGIIEQVSLTYESSA